MRADAQQLEIPDLDPEHGRGPCRHCGAPWSEHSARGYRCPKVEWSTTTYERDEEVAR